MRVALGLVLGALVCVGTWTALVSGPSAPVGADPPSARAACAFVAGAEGAWALTLSGGLSLERSPGMAGNAGLSFGGAPGSTLTGALTWRAPRAASGRRVVLRLHGMQEYTAQKPGVDAPFEATLAPDCSVRALHFDDRHGEEARKALSGLVYLMEVRTRSRSVAQWTERQPDRVGVAATSYRWLKPNVGRLERVRDRYLSGQGEGALDIVQSRLVATILPGRWLESLECTEHLRSRSPSADIAVRLTLEPLVGPLPVGRAAVATPPPPTPPPPTARHALADAGRALGDGEGARVPHAIQALKEALIANPDLAFSLLDALRRGAVRDDLQALVFAALERVGTEQAHEVLRTAVQDAQLSEANRLRATFALPAIDAPDQRTLDTLASAATPESGEGFDRLNNAAVHSLGILDATHDEASPELARSARAELTARLRVPANEDELEAVFGAVGNSGHAALLPLVTPYLEDARLAVRARALRSLRRMPPALTEPMFATLLSDASEHPTLQARLVRTFGEQATASGQPLLAAHVTEAVALLETTEHAGLKEALIKLLGAAATAGSAEARAALVAHYHRERYVELLALIGTYVDATELMRPAGQSND